MSDDKRKPKETLHLRLDADLMDALNTYAQELSRDSNVRAVLGDEITLTHAARAAIRRGLGLVEGERAALERTLATMQAALAVRRDELDRLDDADDDNDGFAETLIDPFDDGDAAAGDGFTAADAAARTNELAAEIDAAVQAGHLRLDFEP